MRGIVHFFGACLVGSLPAIVVPTVVPIAIAAVVVIIRSGIVGIVRLVLRPFPLSIIVISPSILVRPHDTFAAIISRFGIVGTVVVVVRSIVIVASVGIAIVRRRRSCAAAIGGSGSVSR